MLSTFNLPSNNIDPNRQMAMMRTYLSQLKDELETELYNIGWNNLSKELRDKINSLESYKSDVDEKVEMIRAKAVSVDYLTANYITASEISAGYASVGSFNALSATVNNLSAIAITTQNLSAQTIDAGQITTGYINAGRIAAGSLNVNKIADINGNAGNTVWTTLGWVVGVEKHGSNQLKVIYRNFKFLNCGYTGETYDYIDI